jgi:hypothetical protein
MTINDRRQYYGEGTSLPVCLLDLILCRIRLDVKLVVQFRLLHHFGRGRTNTDDVGRGCGATESREMCRSSRLR